MVLAEQAHGWWVIIWPILWIAVIVAALWFLSRRWRPQGGGLDRAREILAERFARGELTSDEYRERLAQLG